MNPKPLLPILCALLLACGPRTVEQRETLRRQPLAPAAQSGWARVVLDREAQRSFPDIWLGDAAGASVPFLVERDGLWQPRELTLERLLVGKDGDGRPTADFRLAFPAGWQVRDREHLRLRFDLEGAAPWVCRVKVQARLEGSLPVTLERNVPLHVFDLGEAGRSAEVVVPWDAAQYRLTLVAVQGAAPRIRGVKVIAATEPSTRVEDLVEVPRMTEQADHTWLLTLDGPDRIVGAEVALKAPVAPLVPHFSVPPEPGRTQGYEHVLASAGMVWNLPALNTSATRVSLGPVTTDRLQMRLPEGAIPESVRLLVRRDALLFPAEAGRAYFLHGGGRVKAAPGNLAGLPDSSRAVYQGAPLALGPGEADPHGLPRVTHLPNPAVPWLPWVAGLAVLVMGALALRLLRGK